MKSQNRPAINFKVKKFSANQEILFMKFPIKISSLIPSFCQSQKKIFSRILNFFARSKTYSQILPFSLNQNQPYSQIQNY